MAYLNMPNVQQDVERQDFIEWADRYIHFPCKEQVTGLELYSARCGMIHSHSIISRFTRKGKCRQIGYVDQSIPEVSYNPAVSTDLVMVSISALAEVFFNGVDKFLVDAFSDKNKAKIVEQRLDKLVQLLPFGIK
jgi:hypothetical protein